MQYTGEIAELVREHGYARTAEILAERKKESLEQATQSKTWQETIAANRRDKAEREPGEERR